MPSKSLAPEVLVFCLGILYFHSPLKLQIQSSLQQKKGNWNIRHSFIPIGKNDQKWGELTMALYKGAYILL